MHTTWTGWKTDPMEIPSCPRCRTALGEDAEICPSCNMRFSEISLYDPKHFVWLGMLFSFMVPAFLGAMNFGRLGRPDLKRAWLVGGILGFGALVLTVMYLGEHIIPQLGLSDYGHRSLIKWGGYAINLPVAGYLFYKQRALFRGALEIGMKPASMVKGTLAGIGITAGIGAFVGFSVGLLSVLAANSSMDNVTALVEEGRFREATREIDRLMEGQPNDPDLLYLKAVCKTAELADAGRFTEALELSDRMLERDPDDTAFRLWKGVCHMGRDEWPDAEQAFRECLEQTGETPEIYVFLGLSCAMQGRPDEAQRYYSMAEEISPGLPQEMGVR